MPAIVHINHQPRLQRGDGPIVLVLAPTRELAQQIKEVTEDFGHSSGIRNTCIFGGAKRLSQVIILNKFKRLLKTLILNNNNCFIKNYFIKGKRFRKRSRNSNSNSRASFRFFGLR